MIGAIVLAAGRSGRMGRQKLLLPLRGRPLITGVVDELVGSPLESITVVVGRDAVPIQAALAGRAVEFAHNPDPDGDMLSSVRCGLRACPASCEAVLVVLGDQPGVTRDLVGGLVRALRDSGRGIVVPAHAGQRGHPLLFAARYREEVLCRYDGMGLHGLLEAHPEAVLEFPVASAVALEDMDTPADYERQVQASSD